MFIEAGWNRPSAGWISPRGDFYPLEGAGEEIHYEWIRNHKALVKKTGVDVDDAVQEGGWPEIESEMYSAGWIRKGDRASYQCDKRFLRQVMEYVKFYEPEVAEVYIDLWVAGEFEQSIKTIVR